MLRQNPANHVLIDTCAMDPEAMGSRLQQVAAAFESRTGDPRSNDSERGTADQSTLHSEAVSHHR